jgi:hypothetical protein
MASKSLLTVTHGIGVLSVSEGGCDEEEAAVGWGSEQSSDSILFTVDMTGKYSAVCCCLLITLVSLEDMLF